MSIFLQKKLIDLAGQISLEVGYTYECRHAIIPPLKKPCTILMTLNPKPSRTWQAIGGTVLTKARKLVRATKRVLGNEAERTETSLCVF
jgi:hypothetical protein